MSIKLYGRSMTSVLIGAYALSASAQSVTLDFNGLTGMPDAPGSPVPASARLSDQFLAEHGILFASDSGSPYVAVVSLGGGNNAIGSVDANGLLAYDAGFHVDFFLPSNPLI